jgi:hypothetical protein
MLHWESFVLDYATCFGSTAIITKMYKGNWNNEGRLLLTVSLYNVQLIKWSFSLWFFYEMEQICYLMAVL